MAAVTEEDEGNGCAATHGWAAAAFFQPLLGSGEWWRRNWRGDSSFPAFCHQSTRSNVR